MPGDIEDLSDRFEDAGNDVDALKGIVGDLIGLVKELNAEQKKYTDSLGDSVKRIGEGKTLFIGVGQSLKSVVQLTKEFATDLKAQYKLTEKLAESYKQTSVNIGIGFQNQKRLGEELFGSSSVLVFVSGQNFQGHKALRGSVDKALGTVIANHNDLVRPDGTMLSSSFVAARIEDGVGRSTAYQELAQMRKSGILSADERDSAADASWTR